MESDLPPASLGSSVIPKGRGVLSPPGWICCPDLQPLAVQEPHRLGEGWLAARRQANPRTLRSQAFLKC